MPSRILREGILSSERVNQLSEGGEVFYRRLMSVVDDYGRFTAHPELLWAACYPLRLKSFDDTAIAMHLQSICDANLAIVYEVDGKRFVQLSDFKQQVRAKVSKCPDPDRKTLITRIADATQTQGVCTLISKAESYSNSKSNTEAKAESGLQSAKAAPPAKDEVKAETQVCIWLAAHGVRGAQPANPKVINFAREGVTEQHIIEAVNIARVDRGKGQESLAFNYLCGILTDVMYPPERKNSAQWWATETSIDAKATEVGLKPNRGELYPQFVERIKRKIAEVSRETPEGDRRAAEAFVAGGDG